MTIEEAIIEVDKLSEQNCRELLVKSMFIITNEWGDISASKTLDFIRELIIHQL